jgi:hypothetical protein
MLTSLLPRINPSTPVVGDAPARHGGTSDSGSLPGDPHGNPAIHVGGPADANGPGYYTGPGSGTTTANLPPGQTTQGAQNNGGAVFVSATDGPSTTGNPAPPTATPLRFGPNPSQDPGTSTTSPPTDQGGHPGHGHKPTPPPSAD